MVFDQEPNVARFELQGFIAKDFRVRKDVKVKRARDVAGLFLVPLEGADTNLKGVHSCAVVFEFLIAIFYLVKAVCQILLVNVKA